MERTVLLIIAVLTLVGMVAPQNRTNSVGDALSGCSIPTAGIRKSRRELTEEEEIRYRSPIRYVIVYNEIGPTDDRRIDILMSVRNINEKDLRTIFCWIGQRYPSPVALAITVHTNLDTIETPDERELLDDGNGTRFSKYWGAYKEAYYHRFESGREAFGYTTRLNPYRERQVVIKESE